MSSMPFRRKLARELVAGDRVLMLGRYREVERVATIPGRKRAVTLIVTTDRRGIYLPPGVPVRTRPQESTHA